MESCSSVGCGASFLVTKNASEFVAVASELSKMTHAVKAIRDRFFRIMAWLFGLNAGSLGAKKLKILLR